jgi:alpha-galactosidase
MPELLKENQMPDIFEGFSIAKDGPAWTRGLFLIDTDQGRYEADALTQTGSYFTSADGKLQVESSWQFDQANKVWTRNDRLKNCSSNAMTIFKAFSRFSFSPGHYDIYSQESRWCNENQGHWQQIDHGLTVLRCEQGRTCQGGTPYVYLHNGESGRGLAFHILPNGNWEIRVVAHPVMNDSLPFVVVEAGLCTENLKLVLQAGEEIKLPEILIQVGSESEISCTANLHRHLLVKHFGKAKPFAPVVYNTWFDVFECLDVTRLRKQLDAAKEIGCEVFVIDAGWYGQSEGNWAEQTGDWREKTTAAFRGQMKEFSDEVRARGLGFGLWMEPERICDTVPVRKEHPEWFIKGQSAWYPDLSQRKVYDYVFSEMSRLVETYDLAWMKVDFNNHLGIDPSGNEFYGYYEAWYRLMDELRKKYSQVFFEACASGGLRSDINTLSHFDGHFLSDTTQPVDVIRISEGALLRLPPGRMTKWVTLRSIGKEVPQYSLPADASPERFVVPGGALWEDTFVSDLDFAVRANEPGMMGFSGDLTSLSQTAKEKLARHVQWYKEHRTFIVGAAGHLLTPLKRKEDRTGWSAIQLQHPQNEESLLFVYRLDDSRWNYRLTLRNLNPSQKYAVINVDTAESVIHDGSSLMKKGLDISLSSKHSAAVYKIKPV